MARNQCCCFRGRCAMEETHFVVTGYRHRNLIWPQDDPGLVTSLKSSKYASFFSAVWNSGGLMKPVGSGTVTSTPGFDLITDDFFFIKLDGWKSLKVAV